MQLARINKDAEQIVDLINRGIQCWTDAGKLLAKNMDEDPEFIEKVCDFCKDISPEALYRLEQVGRGQLYPSLLLNDSPGVRRLRRLPYSLQKKHATEPLTVIVSGGDKLEIDVRNLTPGQAAQVFARDSIRTQAEQRAFLEDRAVMEQVASTGGLPYRIVGKTLVVMAGCKFTTSDLAGIIAKIEA